MNFSFVSFLVPIAILLQSQSPLFAQTSVSGIISTNTTWTKTSSPYNLTGKVQVKEDVTLTIEPGVTVNGDNQQIEVFGGLSAIGNSGSQIIFNNASILGSPLINYFATINIQHARFKGGGVLPTIVGYLMSLTLRDSRLDGCSLMYLTGTIGTANSFIERNIFSKSGGIDTWINGSSLAYIRNNVFYQQTGSFAIQNRVSSFSGTSTVAEYNSFLSTDRVAINLPSGHSQARVTAMNNYWNTTDVNLINSMITDRNDDLQIASVVPYLPILTAPHASTPGFPLISQSLSSLTFANVPSGSSSTQTFRLKNTGSGTLSISNITPSNNRFSVTPTSATLSAGDSVTISVTFSPLTFGQVTGTLTITHNAENTLSSISFSAIGLSPSISIVPLSLDFGKVTVGKSHTGSLQISNVGNSLLTVDSIVTNNSLFELQTNGFTVAAGTTTSTTLTYRPTAVLKDSTSLLIYHNAPNSPSSIILRGEGVRSNLLLSTPNIVFAAIGYKPWIDTTLVFTNVGGDSLRISSIASDNPTFIPRRSAFIVPPLQSLTDTVRFSPVNVGTHAGRLLISSDSPTSPDTVILSGTRDVLSHEEGTPDLPMQYILNQNYPNPFNPSTRISLSLAKPGFTSLKVYNFLGQQVGELVAEQLPAGTHHFIWMPLGLPTGIYIYRINSGEFTHTKKMLFIK